MFEATENEVKLYRLSRRMNLYIDDDPSAKRMSFWAFVAGVDLFLVLLRNVYIQKP